MSKDRFDVRKLIFGKKAEKDLGSQYVPFTVGLPKLGSPFDTEYFIVGKNSGDNQNKALKAVLTHKARLISFYSCPANEDNTQFFMSFVVDGSEMGRTADDLLIMLRKLDFTLKAERVSFHNKIFSNYVFPVKE